MSGTKSEAKFSLLERDPNEPELAVMRLFRETDLDGSGFLDEEEITALCNKMGIMLSAKGIKAAMNEMDADGSGEVDFEEFNEWWAVNGGESLRRFPPAEPEPAVVKLFKQTDTDGSGSLDAQEIASMCKRMGLKLSAKGIQKAMAQMDEDGSGEVDFDEFNEWWGKNGGKALKNFPMARRRRGNRDSRLPKITAADWAAILFTTVALTFTGFALWEDQNREPKPMADDALLKGQTEWFHQSTWIAKYRRAWYTGFLITMVITGIWAIYQLYVFHTNKLRAAAKAAEVPKHLRELS
eukprot:SAG31_NODE_1903_length_6956_cov_3.288902_8_plen_296_part_00